MSSTDIITGQYVRIRQTAANVGDRIVARLIDYVIIGFYGFAMSVLLVAFFGAIGGNAGNSIWALSYLVLVFVPCTFYSFFFEWLWHGQTLGKRLRKLRVVSIDGSQPTLGRLFMRWIFLSIDVWVSCIGILPIAFSKRHQRFGDMAAGTMVIHLDDYEQWHDALDDFYYLQPDYKPVYPQAEQLSDGQADLIRRTLYAPGGYDIDQVDRLAAKVAQFLHVKKKESNAALFLTSVFNDYQYFTLRL